MSDRNGFLLSAALIVGVLVLLSLTLVVATLAGVSSWSNTRLLLACLGGGHTLVASLFLAAALVAGESRRV